MPGCSCAPDANERLLPILPGATSVPSLRVQHYLNWHPPIFPRDILDLSVLRFRLFISVTLFPFYYFFILERNKLINKQIK